MQFIDLKAQYEFAKNRIDKRIAAVLEHGQYIMGPEVSELEEQLAHYVGVKHAITCANGTDALQLALMAMGIGPGDAVIVPTFTFFASAEAVAFVGSTPVFADVDPRTFNLDCEKLATTIRQVEASSSLKLKAIMAVDLFGQPAAYEHIQSIASAHNLLVIEDAAQGVGGERQGKRAGSFGDIATTSFFPAKPLGCYGDGGAVFTNNDDYAALVKSLRVHGKGADKYDNVRIGMNSRLDTLQAAVLLEKLALFPAELERRQYVARLYSEGLESCPSVVTPLCPADVTSSWAQYTLQAQSVSRSILQQSLQHQHIPTAVYYATCMHQQSAFRGAAPTLTDLPVAESLAACCFSLPMHPYLADDEVERVILTLQNTSL
ncbi:DegT/DnrJ/EryC1/StrS family aminotransferase [Alteromonas oceani]|uniref:DegT/DnrJ/EryC1/StrS family aminotransferase n=1 Tax=Alteromonas oceani TaxID=2071609 RepID=A0ABV7JTU5_9ALTE|nr:DegT/DnrJ/EryC1/StrS family aminotransferase [Alteromonas oceani]